MSSDFRIGDEVVCIDVEPGPNTQNPQNLTKLQLNAVYVVSAVGMKGKGGCIPALGLTEFGSNSWWEAARFRKVQKKFTGMTILHSLLITQPELVS